MNHKRRGPKSTRGGCLLCKPHKHQAVKDTLSAQTRQEQVARITEAEQRTQDAALPDFSTMRDVWEGLPCPEEDHVWGRSNLVGYLLRTCILCGADAELQEDGTIS